MSSTTCETFHWMNPVLIVAFLISLFMPRLERFILYFMLIFSTITHWHYGTVIVEQMCEHFNRICFGVGKRRSINDEKK
jgi:ethanolaminephosphotransferase